MEQSRIWLPDCKAAFLFCFFFFPRRWIYISLSNLFLDLIVLFKVVMLLWYLVPARSGVIACMEPTAHIWPSFCHLVQVRRSDFCSYHNNSSAGIFCLSWFICFYLAYPLQILISYLMQIFLLFPEKYFDMKKNQCKEGLDIYKKFLTRMTRISEFLKVAEVNLSQSTLPFIWSSLFCDETDASSFLLICYSLKHHLVHLPPHV